MLDKQMIHHLFAQIINIILLIKTNNNSIIPYNNPKIKPKSKQIIEFIKIMMHQHRQYHP